MSDIRTGPAAAITARPPRTHVMGHLVESGTVVYELAAGPHRQRGLLVEQSIDDYRDGRIRTHEATDPERVGCLENMLEAASAEQVPVTLFHPASSALRALLADAAAGEPLVSRRFDGDRAETVWVVDDPDRSRAIQHELAGIDVLYIADGHHRMSAADHFTAHHPSADRFVLAALFPADEMRVLGYHRCLTLPGRTPAPDLLDKLAGLPAAAWLAECESADALQPAPGVVGVHFDGRWYRLGLAAPVASDPRAALDIVVLEDSVFTPLTATSGIARDAVIRSVPGSAGPASFARDCAGQDSLGFLLHPPSVAQIMAVADAGLAMPAKSTWFDPKPAAGLFHRERPG